MKLLLTSIFVIMFVIIQIFVLEESINTRLELYDIIESQNEEISDLKSKLDECTEVQLVVIDEAIKWGKPKECKKVGKR